MKNIFLSGLFCFLSTGLIVVGDDIKIGIIGTDTSHVVAFAGNLNHSDAKDHVPGAKITGAFKGGSKDIKSSYSRVDEYAKTLEEKHGVKIYDTIEELCKNVDAICLESVDGRPHLEQAKIALKAHKPMFVDKPMAGSLKDVVKIFELAKKENVPIFSSSSLRFAKDSKAAQAGQIGKISYAETSGPCELEKHHPELFWYGVHGVEALYTVMGTGCETVVHGKTSDGKIQVTGTWAGGRKGIFTEGKFQGLAKGEKGEMAVGSFDGYVPLVVEIVKFFQTGKPPVTPKETIEIFAFMEAADASKAKDGAPIKISEVLKKSGAKL